MVDTLYHLVTYIIALSIVIIIVAHNCWAAVRVTSLRSFQKQTAHASPVWPSSRPIRHTPLCSRFRSTPCSHTDKPPRQQRNYLSHRATISSHFSLHFYLVLEIVLHLQQITAMSWMYKAIIQNLSAAKHCTKSCSDHLYCAVSPDFEDCSTTGIAGRSQPVAPQTRTTAVSQTSWGISVRWRGQCRMRIREARGSTCVRSWMPIRPGSLLLLLLRGQSLFYVMGNG